MYPRLAELILLLTLALSGLAATAKRDSVLVVPGQPSDGPSIVQFAAAPSGFDGPKVTNLNSTTFDLWYFDAVSYDLSYSAVVVFFTAEPGALFPGAVDLGTADYVEIFITTPYDAFVTVVGADSLTVTTSGDGSSGTLDGDEAGWTGQPDMSQYTVNINAPDAGIIGTLSFASTALAHYPCGPASDPTGLSFELAPGLGWANAVPDANAAVNLNLSGEEVVFNGIGYHDKNWGSQPWDTLVDSWYWGHARLGTYSIVWFDFIDTNGKEGVSAYVSQEGQILAATCSGLSVRPTGGDETFPPTTQTGLPDGFTMSFDVPGQGTLEIQLLDGDVILSSPGESTRWIGPANGTLGGKQLDGIALYEQFTFAA